MKRTHRRILNLILALALLVTGMAVIDPTSSQAAGTKNAAASDKMEVHFMDVGQGDSTLITCGDDAMLIDAGDDSKGTAIQSYLQKQGIRKLDYLILTHPDADHIGGAPVIITKFDIDKVFMSNFEKDNKTYQKLIQALDNKHLKYSTPKTGEQYTLGTATITILAPNQKYDNPNDASVSLIVQNGNNKFLFTGDAEEEAEQDILNNNIDISADVYKVGHHGSRYSTSQSFFKAVSPTYAVISCGEGNSYGHPHAETLNTLRMNGVKVYRTDEDGTIIASSDGRNIAFNVPASETWKAGEPTGSSAKQQNASQAQSQSGQAQSQSGQVQSQSGQTQSQSGQVQSQSGQPESQSQGAQSQQPQVQSQQTQPEVVETAPAVNEAKSQANASDAKEITYVLNVKTKKFHRPTCGSLPTTNRQDTSESRDSVIAQGYDPCKRCNP